MKLARTRPDATVPTMPMVDLVFLLFVVFVVTAVFSASRGLELALPQEQPIQSPAQAQATVIKVAADGSLTVDCHPMDSNRLLDYLQPLLARDPEKLVILYTDAYAPYQAMVSVYDVLASAEPLRGFRVKNVSVPTQSEVQEYIELVGYNPFEAPCGA